MKKLLTLLLVLLTAGSASAQITIPNTFSPNTVAQSSLVNANFSQLGSLALNRAGGNLTGNLTADGGVTIDGIDIGATICTTCDPTFDDVTLDTLTAVSATFSSTLAVTGAVTLTSTLAVNSTAANAIDVAGGITAGSGNVALVDTTGKIPAISSTYFASLSGANLTGILESAITDSTILARVASTETISGTWTFTSGVKNLSASASPFLNYIATGQAANNQFWRTGINVSTWFLSAVDDAGTSGNFALQVTRSGTTPQLLTITSAVAFDSTLSPAALANGNNNNYAPTGHAAVYLFRLTGDGGGSTLTGLAGGVAGRRVTLCAITTDTITITDEDANSTAANRFADLSGVSFILGTGTGSIPCIDAIYDGTSSRWRLIGRGI